MVTRGNDATLLPSRARPSVGALLLLVPKLLFGSAIHLKDWRLLQPQTLDGFFSFIFPPNKQIILKQCVFLCFLIDNISKEEGKEKERGGRNC